jgi:hypothetical protein
MNERLFFLRLLLASIFALISFSIHGFLSSRYENVLWLAPFYFLLIGFGAELGNFLGGKKTFLSFERLSDKNLFLVSLAVPTLLASFIILLTGTINWMLIFALAASFLSDFYAYHLGSPELKERTMFSWLKKFFS